MRELQLLALYRSHHLLDWKWVTSLDDAQPEMAYAAFISANNPKKILCLKKMPHPWPFNPEQERWWSTKGAHKFPSNQTPAGFLHSVNIELET